MEKVNAFFDETGRFVFAFSVVIMILTHGFCFGNIMYSHDSLRFYTDGLSKVGYGRWLYPFLVHKRLFATPWLMGAFSILYVSLAVVLVVKLCDFNKIQGACVSILFGSNVTLTALFCSYIYDADADCLGLFLACLAVYALKFPKYIDILISVLSLVLCMALYQAYICVAVGLFIILLINKSGRCNSWHELLPVFLLGLKELTTLILAIAIYIPLMHAAAKHYKVELSSSYNGAANLGLLTLHDLIEDIPITYKYFGDTFFDITGFNTITIVRMNWIMILLLVISIAIYIISHRKFLGSLVIMMPGVFLMPLALNAVHLISFGTMHHLMIFAFCIAYLLPLVFMSVPGGQKLETEFMNKILSYTSKAVYIVSAVAIFIIGFNNIVYANGAYVYRKLVYDNTALHAQTIWRDINNIDGYNEGETQVVFMGEFKSSKAAYDSSIAARYYEELIGASNSAITYSGTGGSYFYAILGRSLKIAYRDPSVLEYQEYWDMPVYPQNGYCKMIGDRVIVKLNDQL